MMKYFTLDDWISQQDIKNVDMDAIHQKHKDQKDYIAGITDKLPPDLVRFNQEIIVHDGCLRKLELNVEQKQAVLTIDASSGVKLQYNQVISLCSTSDPQKGLAGPYGYGDIGWDEIELIVDGLFEHRFLFSSGIELAIQFGGFTFNVMKE